MKEHGAKRRYRAQNADGTYLLGNVDDNDLKETKKMHGFFGGQWEREWETQSYWVSYAETGPAHSVRKFRH